jgi:hypothetical protein
VPSTAVPEDSKMIFFSLLFLLCKSIIESLPLSLPLYFSLSLSLSSILSLSFSSALSLSLSACASSMEAEATLALFLSLFELVITAEGAMVVVEFLKEIRGRERWDETRGLGMG